MISFFCIYSDDADPVEDDSAVDAWAVEQVLAQGQMAGCDSPPLREHVLEFYLTLRGLAKFLGNRGNSRSQFPFFRKSQGWVLCRRGTS